MPKTAYLLVTLLCIGALLAGCNLPFFAEGNPVSVQTAAALTVEAQLTAVAPATATFTLVPFPTLPPITNTVPPVNTLPPAATATTNCDAAQFVADVTIPDGTLMDPSETFTKTWRIKNVGSCTWSGYNLVFDSGDLMSGTSPIAIGTVAPNQSVDLSENLTAPASDGSYRGYWRIRNANGVLLPVYSGYQGKSFYVDIKVGSTTAFAVEHVTYTMSNWSDSGHTNCPRVTASITTNGPGTVTYHWTRSDGTTIPTNTLTFNSSGTQSVNYDWAVPSASAGASNWVGIYIDLPNHQDFGHQNFTTACTSP